MLKGHVFSKQIFGNPIFALFVNTFLNGKNGISNNYKNGMAVTVTENTVTIDSGAICIQGRFLEEDTSTTISAGTDTAFCKLVIEIDLDKQNTESEFLQGAYKIVKSTSTYPTLTQTDIVKNNAGVYQYELARFKTSANGITEFSDRRTFLDFQSVYDAIETEYITILNQLQEKLANVEDGSAYVLKNDYEQDLNNLLATTTTNSNGTAIKFPDGTMIVTQLHTFSPLSITEQTGSIFRGVADLTGKPFPENFIEVPFVSYSISKSNTSRDVWIGQQVYLNEGMQNPTVKNAGMIRLLSGSSVDAWVTIGVLAIGRWK